MPSVAEQLRQAREEQKLSVHDVAEATKIKTDHVRALESGEYKVFAAPVYIRGFVRTYATLLRLNVTELINDLENELSQSEQFREPTSLVPRQRTWLDVLSLVVAKVNWRLAIAFAIFILVGCLAVWGYQAWRRARSADPLSKLGPGLYQSPRGNNGEVLPLPAPSPKP